MLKMNYDDIYMMARDGDYGLIVGFDYDDYNIRDYMDQTVKIALNYNGCELGDKTDYDIKDYNSYYEMEADIMKNEDAFAVIGLYVIEHGQINIETDEYGLGSYMDGAAWITKKDALEIFGGLEEEHYDKAVEMICKDVSQYNDYLNGGLVYYKLIKALPWTYDVLDSCYGFLMTDTIAEDIKGYLPAKFAHLADKLELIRS